MSSFWKFAFVVFVTGLSGLTCAEAVVTLTGHAPVFRATSAQAPVAPVQAEAMQTGQRATIAKSADGHFWVDGQVNNATVRFLVDTGATAVSLTPRDAEHLGISPADLDFKYHVVTASGDARAARVKLEKVAVAGATLQDVDALVIEKGLDTSLLGMTYLGRLASFQATRNALILQP